MKSFPIRRCAIFAALLQATVGALAAHPQPAPPSQVVQFTPRGQLSAQRGDIHARDWNLWTPRGARTEFLGWWRGSFGTAKTDEKLVAHFYSLATPRAAGGDGGKSQFGLFLDVWRAGKQHQNRPRRLNHIALRTAWKALNGNWNRQSDRLFQLHLRRLDARGQILMLQATGDGASISGVVGCEAVAVFPLGLDRAPRLQSFDTYMTAMGGQQVFFDRRDQGSVLQARIVSTSVPDRLSPGSLTSTRLWNWNGQAFTAPTPRRKAPRR